MLLLYLDGVKFLRMRWKFMIGKVFGIGVRKKCLSKDMHNKIYFYFYFYFYNYAQLDIGKQ
jgi:hypothetical protein